MSSRPVIVMLLSVAALVGGGLSAGTASAAASPAAHAPASVRAAKATPAPNGVQLPAAVSQTPVASTPDVYAGSDCGQACTPASTVYATAVVNGEVVVAGAFTQVCTPASARPTYAECPGTVNADYIFAYNPANGAIDPDFTPVLNAGPVNALAAGPNGTVYIGGSFTTVNGVSTGGLAELQVTPGQSGDGQLVPGFNATADGTVNGLAVSGTSLYVGGQLATVDGWHRKIVRLNATTGALDRKFDFTLTNPFSGQTLQVKAMSLTNDGTTLAIAGPFQDVNGTAIPRLALISTGGTLGQGATLDDWAAPILENTCSHQHNYINGLDFSPDGSFFVIADTGYMSNGQAGVCDATARFNTAETGTNVQPAWINYTGGDSLHSVAIAGSVVYIGGHQRFANNECGSNGVCEANAVLVNGLSAIDANTGVALAWWHPQSARGVGIESLTPYPAGTFAGSKGGLLIGTNVGNIAGKSHHELAMLPEATTSAPAAGGPIESGIFATGRLGGLDESGQGVAAMCMDDAGNSTNPGNPVDLVTCANDNEQNWTVANGTIGVNGLCLDTSGEGTGSGTPVVVSTCNGSATQQWQQSTGNTVIDQAAGICLTDPNSSTSNGTQLQIQSCTGSTSQIWPLPVAPAPPAPPVTGSFYLQQNQHNSDVPCATDKNNSLSQGTPVVMQACLGQAAQNWTLESNGTIEVNGLCLDTQNEDTFPGTPVDLASCNGRSTQEWSAESGYLLGNEGTRGLCLSDPNGNTANGVQLDIYYCQNETSEQWRLPNY
jgi:hypothetical protein